MRILISGGGTGGHIYPALAVARELRDRFGADILYLGDKNGLETRIVPAAGFAFAAVSAGKLRRYLSARTITDLGRVPLGMAQALGHVRRFKPDVAFTSGGYVSVPAGLAARTQGVPLVMHQQDVPPNLANRLLAPFATRISVSFPGSLRFFPKVRTTLAGNPVREEVLRMSGLESASVKPQFGLNPTVPVVLVTGGSQGARHLNQVVVEALPQLLPRCQVLHVSGTLTHEATHEAAERQLSAIPELRGRYLLYPYLEAEMPAALAASDMVLCRSGAATLAELAVLGRPSLLVPLPPGFTGSPQQVNAEMFRAAGAAEMLLDKDMSPERLCALLFPLLDDRVRREHMAQAARTFGHLEAAATLADTVAALAQRQIERRTRG
ncbi:MAG TPA: undecaprenyldiphospho-muramoylpentapeptide beta-N-acetylglucosaminyltransferase [Ktedonobacterales bacterium]|nr:undecaprenyldiphospho-muramoylpentapeptide beta-N-acetylglucosaminyltransferase [Ktedonobacterales bacterium]